MVSYAMLDGEGGELDVDDIQSFDLSDDAVDNDTASDIFKGGDVEMILGLGYLTSSYERGNERRRLRMGDLGQKPSKLFNPQIFHWFYWLD